MMLYKNIKILAEGIYFKKRVEMCVDFGLFYRKVFLPLSAYFLVL